MTLDPIEADEKKSFVLYYSMIEQVKRLNDHQIADLFRAILSTGGVCAMPELDALTDMAFVPIRRELEENARKWEETRKVRKENGKLGGKKKAENAKARLANSSKSTEARNTKNAEDDSLANLANLAVDDAVAVAGDVDVADDPTSLPQGHTVVQRGQRGALESTGESATEVCAASAAPYGHTAPIGHTAPKGHTADINQHFESLWALYPVKRGKKRVSARTKRALYNVSREDMATAIARYKAEVESASFDRSWLNGSTWFNERYSDYLGDDYTPAPQVAKTPAPSARSRAANYRSETEKADTTNYYATREE